MAEPIVSVVIPAYNTARLIGAALRSVLAQTFTSFEVIVVDDGSQDDTREVVAGFGERVRLIAQANAGAAAARNRGIAQARGAWIAFLDADDEWRPGHLAHLLAAAAAAPEAHLVYGSKITVDEQGVPIPHNVVARFPTGWIFRELVEDCLITTSTTMARRDTLLTVGGFDEDPRFKVTQDWDLYFRFAAIHPIAASRDTHVAYRRLSGSLSHQIVPTILGNIAALRTAERLVRDGRVAAENRPELLDMRDRWRRAYEEAVIHTFTEGHYAITREVAAAARARGYLTGAALPRALASRLPPQVIDQARQLVRMSRRRLRGLGLR